MSPLFQNSSKRWKDVAQQMGAQYQLWSADELDALVKNKYPQFWSTYVKAALSVMRVHIDRLCILHRHGGMYVDLDVNPNRATYAEASLPVQKIFLTGHQRAMKTWLPPKTCKHNVPGQRHPVANKSNVLDMEVLIASADNPILLQWLCYISNQKKEKDLEKQKAYQMCYIGEVTRPKCMRRFLKLKSSKDILRNLEYLTSNNFAEEHDLSMSANRMYDGVTYESKSYYGERDVFKFPVGDGNGPLPVLCGSQPQRNGMALSQAKEENTEVGEKDSAQERPRQRPRHCVTGKRKVDECVETEI